METKVRSLTQLKKANDGIQLNNVRKVGELALSKTSCSISNNGQILRVV
jgi:hypothetical protein